MIVYEYYTKNKNYHPNIIIFTHLPPPKKFF